jgi:phospholipase C
MYRSWSAVVVACAAIGLLAFPPAWAGSPNAKADVAPAAHNGAVPYASAGTLTTATPIKHLVVIFQENVSFDHYFGTYPHAANKAGETKWKAKAGTPTVHGLTSSLLTSNPNSANPVRLSAKQALTCDMDHGYNAEQKAEDHGLMDKFIQYTQGTAGDSYQYCPAKNIVMGYYDGNTVTALWNYAQNFALSDNFWGSTFGPSSVGAINLVSGDTGTALCGPTGVVLNAAPCTSTAPDPKRAKGTLYSDADPYYDACSDNGAPDPSKDVAMSGPNIGTMLSATKVTWGWFEGGFGNCLNNPPMHGPTLALQKQGATVAQDTHDQSIDYSPHHEPFQFYAATANPNHLTPTSTAMIGSQDRANHQYDLTSFWAAANAGKLPAVSFLKAPRYQDGHASYSDPLDEQNFLVTTINRIEKLSTWSSTAIVIAYDDSDGWYDHMYGPEVNQSNASIDFSCGTTPVGTQPGRCGYGPRLPLLVVSAYAKSNYVSHTLVDQSSIIRFIEDNWLGSKRVDAESFDNKAGSLSGMFNFKNGGATKKVFMNPLTGQIIKS